MNKLLLLLLLQKPSELFGVVKNSPAKLLKINRTLPFQNMRIKSLPSARKRTYMGRNISYAKKRAFYVFIRLIFTICSCTE